MAYRRGRGGVGGSTPPPLATVNLHFRILKMIATSGFLAALECTKFVFGQSSAPDPAGGVYSASPDPPAGLTGVEGKGEWKEEGSEGKELR